MRSRWVSFAILLCLLPGCAARYSVQRVADAKSDKPEGFRYYLPAPYLLITNMTVVATPTAPTGGGSPAKAPASEGKDQGTKAPSNGGQATNPGAKDLEKKAPNDTRQETNPGTSISVQLVWLPDPDQEYAIRTTTMLAGSFNGSIQLNNGWQLTGVSEQRDAKLAETLNAVSGILGTLFTAGGLPTGAAPKSLAGAPPEGQPPKPFLLLFKVDLKNHSLTPVCSDFLNDALRTVMQGKPLTVDGGASTSPCGARAGATESSPQDAQR